MFRSLKHSPYRSLTSEEITNLLARHFKVDSDQNIRKKCFDNTDYLLYKENLPSLIQSERLMTESGEIIFLEIGEIRDRTS